MSNTKDAPKTPDHFQSKADAIKWVLEVHALEGKGVRTLRSDPGRVYFGCTEDECDFLCRVKRCGDGLFRFSCWEWHSCDLQANPKIRPAWVVEKAKELLSERDTVKPAELKVDLQHRLAVEVQPIVARKAVARARQELDDENASFDKLPGMFEALKAQNPGTVAEIVLEDGRFSMAFLCPGPCARAWEHCLKIIALDGTHGTSRYKGVVHVATALDGAGQIFPIACGFAAGETKDSWTFFVNCLADALNIRDTPLTVTSDRCKGIDTAVSEVLPRAAHSFCAYHIAQNVTQRYGKAAAAHVWAIANAGNEHEYTAAMRAVGVVSPPALQYLMTIPREHWVRGFFPMPRFGQATSNIAESINAWLVECRKFPPLQFFNRAIAKTNELFARRRAMYANGNPEDIVGDVFATMVQNYEDGRRLLTQNVFGPFFNVESRVAGRAERVVDLDRRECSCKEFQDLGYPCVHACAAARSAHVDIAPLCLDERRVGSLRAVYEIGIIPVDMETVVPEDVEPPVFHRQAGRPKTKRIRKRHEGKRKRIVFCTICGQTGHNKRSCPQNNE